MATISYDGHSFIVDSRRIWLVSGALDYARIPPDLWRDRLRAARQAGLNCIQTSALWSLHEPQPGSFRFDGGANLREFVRMVGEEGMWCVLRPGPYVGGGWDMGGMPPWLLEQAEIADEKRPPMRLREADPRFLQAIARYLDALMEQVRDLQITEPTSGPLLLMQTEHEWFSHHARQAEAYLNQINRFLRESGSAVPLLNTNNLYQQVAGTIDAWDGDGAVLANARQLRVLQSDAPRMIMSLPTGRPDIWDQEHRDDRTGERIVRQMARASAAGAMVNVDPICGGTNFGFSAGRLSGGEPRLLTTSNDRHAPVSETGGRRDKYERLKRLATFLSQFPSLMGGLGDSEHHTVAASGVSVVQQTGSQGSVVFLIREEERRSRNRHVDLITPDGQEFTVDLGDDPAAWIALNVNLGGLATLDLTNLRPWALVGGRMLVVYGPAGSDGLLSVDGNLFAVTVPNGVQPQIIEHESITIALLNEKQVDAAVVEDEQLWIGVSGIDGEGQPLPHSGFARYSRIDANGNVKRHNAPKTHKPTAPRLGKVTCAAPRSYVDGTAQRYAMLPGPRSLESCGADFGYGWYKLRLRRNRARKANVMMPEAGGRLHLYEGGKLKRIIGPGPGGSEDPFELNVAPGDTDLVILADNPGRFAEDLPIDRPTGIWGHLLDVKPVKLNKPDQSFEPRIDPFELSGYVPHCNRDEHGPFARYTFSFTLSAKNRMVLAMSGERPRSVVLVNNKPVAIDPGHGLTARHLLREHLHKGSNKITLATIDPLEDERFDPRNNATLYHVQEVLTEKADFWYARWHLPDERHFEPVPANLPAAPAFFRTSFNVKRTDRPLLLEVNGPTKGQIYLNGRNLGRYFVATQTGKKVQPQQRYYLPEPWLNEGGENELIFFDEHGKAPSRCRLTYDDYGPFGK